MLKMISRECPYEKRIDVKDIPTGRTFHKSGLFGGDIVEYKKVAIPVPDYPATNKKLIEMLCEIIKLNLYELGEIRHAVIAPSLDDPQSYIIRVEGAYANLNPKNMAVMKVPKGFGEELAEPTPAAYHIRKIKMLFNSMISELPYSETSTYQDFINKMNNLFDSSFEQAMDGDTF